MIRVQEPNYAYMYVCVHAYYVSIVIIISRRWVLTFYLRIGQFLKNCVVKMMIIFHLRFDICSDNKNIPQDRQ
jgi:hypothetical protein